MHLRWVAPHGQREDQGAHRGDDMFTVFVTQFLGDGAVQVIGLNRRGLNQAPPQMIEALIPQAPRSLQIAQVARTDVRMQVARQDVRTGRR